MFAVFYCLLIFCVWCRELGEMCKLLASCLCFYVFVFSGGRGFPKIGADVTKQQQFQATFVRSCFPITKKLIGLESLVHDAIKQWITE